MKKRNYIIWFVALLILVLGVNWVFSAAERDRVVMVGGTNIVFAVYDEDDMSSDDSLGFATQQSIKQFAINGANAVYSSYTDGSGFVITATDGNTWMIDLTLGKDESAVGDGSSLAVGKQTSGLTVVLPTTITQAMDGQPMTFIVSNKAGATNMVLWGGASDGSNGTGTATSGVSIENITGVTNDALDADTNGDSITLMPSFTNQIYYYKGSHIQ